MVSYIKGGMQAKDISKTGYSSEYRRPKGRLHNQEVHSFYRSSNIVRAIKFRILRWAVHVVRMEEGRILFKF